jgi:hypothetical protein
VDRLVELAKHPRPIGVLIQLRKALGEIRDLVEDLEITFDRRFEIRTLNFYRDFFPCEKTRSINLTERRRGNWLELEIPCSTSLILRPSSFSMRANAISFGNGGTLIL